MNLPNFNRNKTNMNLSKNLKVIPLGGVEEIGFNSTVIEYENDLMKVIKILPYGVRECSTVFPLYFFSRAYRLVFPQPFSR